MSLGFSLGIRASNPSGPSEDTYALLSPLFKLGWSFDSQDGGGNWPSVQGGEAITGTANFILDSYTSHGNSGRAVDTGSCASYTGAWNYAGGSGIDGDAVSVCFFNSSQIGLPTNSSIAETTLFRYWRDDSNASPMFEVKTSAFRSSFPFSSTTQVIHAYVYDTAGVLVHSFDPLSGGGDFDYLMAFTINSGVVTFRCKSINDPGTQTSQSFDTIGNSVMPSVPGPLNQKFEIHGHTSFNPVIDELMVIGSGISNEGFSWLYNSGSTRAASELL